MLGSGNSDIGLDVRVMLCFITFQHTDQYEYPDQTGGRRYEALYIAQEEYSTLVLGLVTVK
jgi:hypothetical protein